MKNYISPELKLKVISLREKISTEGEFGADEIIWGSSTPNESWLPEN